MPIRKRTHSDNILIDRAPDFDPARWHAFGEQVGVIAGARNRKRPSWTISYNKTEVGLRNHVFIGWTKIIDNKDSSSNRWQKSDCHPPSLSLQARPQPDQIFLDTTRCSTSHAEPEITTRDPKHSIDAQSRRASLLFASFPNWDKNRVKEITDNWTPNVVEGARSSQCGAKIKSTIHSSE